MSEQSSSSEKRKFPRLKDSCVLRFRQVEADTLPEDGIEALTVNISGGGICFSSPSAVEVGSLLAIELTLPDRSVRYGATKSGVHRTVKPAGGVWAPDPAGPLIEWDEPGSLRFEFAADGLVTVALGGDGGDFRTAAVPGGENGLMGGGI